MISYTYAFGMAYAHAGSQQTNYCARLGTDIALVGALHVLQ